MKISWKRILFICLLFAQIADIQAKPLDFYFTVKRYFETETNQSYVEFAYLIPGNIVTYKETAPDLFQGKVLVVLDLINPKDEIVFTHSYIIQSPTYGPSPEALANLSDLLNIPLTEDSLKLFIQALDLNDSTAYFQDELVMTSLGEKNGLLSDIALVGSKSEGSEQDLFYKGGHILVPKFINYYPQEINTLSFYVESYHKVAGEKSMFKYFISDENNVVIDKYSNFKKTNGTNSDAMLAAIDISKLPSGNYYVYVELRNETNALLDRKRMYFQRLNNAEEVDNVDYYELDVVQNNFAKKYDLRNITHHLKALKPLADEFEKAAIDGAIKSKELDVLHSYFYSFWSKRDSKNPEDRWMEYADLLQYADQEFGNSMIEGHETSRGRVYLQYGKPLERIERFTPKYGNIEIWRYEQINKQGNVEFLFIENQIFDDEFQLVHSNLNNEIFSKQWSTVLKTNNF